MIKLNLATYKPLDIPIPESTQDGLEFAVTFPRGWSDTSEYDRVVDELTEPDEQLPEEQYHTEEDKSLYEQLSPELLEALRIQPTTHKRKPKESAGSGEEVGRWSNDVYSNESNWVESMKNAYRRAGITNNDVLDLLISQDSIESNWGKSAQGSFNYGNITTGSGYKGKYVVGRDKDRDGNPIQQRFRAYDSVDDYVKDKIALLKRSYDMTGNESTDELIGKLLGNNKKKFRYAEAANYSDILKSRLKRYRRNFAS